MEKRKPTYQQALALEKAQQARRNNLRRAQQAPTQTDAEREKWEADKKAALAAYRAKQNA